MAAQNTRQTSVNQLGVLAPVPESKAYPKCWSLHACILRVAPNTKKQEAVWNLAATKSGEEASYQGVVSGTISISNSKPVPVAVYGVLTAVKGGPSATVNCGPSMPFQVWAEEAQTGAASKLACVHANLQAELALLWVAAAAEA